MFVTLAPALTVTDRFARIMDALCRVVAASRTERLGPGPLIILIWTRLRRMAARLTKLAARVQAGTLPKQRAKQPPSDENTRRTRGENPRHTCASRYPGMPASFLPGSPPPRLPNTFGWLIRMVPAAACCRSQLHHLLSDPEFATLLTAAPQMGRVLRPLCRMLAIKVPEFLARAPVDPSPDLLPPPCADPAPRARPPAAGPTTPAATEPHPPDPSPALSPTFPRPALA
jgi:hypothetical protein